MADIIKTGTVKIDIVRGKSDVKAPDIAPILAAKEKEVALNEQLIQQEKAVQDAAEKAAAAQLEASRKITEESLKRLDGMSQMAEGMLKIGRAAVLAGTAGGASMKELLTVLIAFQIATDLFTGATAALKGFVAWLGAAKIATLGLAGAIAILESLLLPIVIVLAALAAAWLYVSQANAKAAEEEKAYAAATKERDAAIRAAHKAEAEREKDIQAQIRATLSLREQQAALAAMNPAEMAKDANFWSGQAGDSPRTEAGAEAAARMHEKNYAIAQDAVGLLNQQASVEKSLNEDAMARLNVQEQMIQSKVKELDLARQTLKTEEAKTAAFAVQFGMLSKGEQERLKRIDKKISGGEALTKSELQVAMKAGGGFADAAGKAYAEKARQAGFNDINSFKNPATAAAQAAVQNAAGAISEITGGARPDEALAQIKAQKAELEKALADYMKTNKEMLRKALADLNQISARQGKVEAALANIKVQR